MKISRIIFLVLLTVIVGAPFLQQCTGIIKGKGLSGWYEQVATTTLTFDSWWDGSYQTNADQWLKQNAGFRADFVRLRNQYDYSVFNIVNSVLVVGKENYLFEPPYLNAYRGTDFLGEEHIKAKVEKLAVIRDHLKDHNTEIIFVIVPSKARYYPEYVPGAIPPTGTPTNYDSYKLQLELNNIHIVDFQSLFIDWKETTPYPLFTKYGTHWSIYGAVQAIDSLIAYMSAVKHEKYVSYRQVAIEKSEKARFTDADLLPLLNLVKKWKCPTMYYPVLEFDTIGVKPKVVSMSDSFFWSFYHIEAAENCFDSRSMYWFYYRENFGTNRNSAVPQFSELNKLKEMEDADFLIITCAEPNLKDFAYGFIEETYKEITKDGF